MKKNITINLFGELYAIDEDAYELLNNYLDSMKRYFLRQVDGAEIADDIEHRVAELLWEKREAGMTAVSIIMLVSIFLPVPTVIIYLILWIVVPEACTTEDRLRMQGIDVTPENLNEELLRSGLRSKEASEKPRRSGCLWALIIVIALPVMAIAMLWLSVFFQVFRIIPNIIF